MAAMLVFGVHCRSARPMLLSGVVRRGRCVMRMVVAIALCLCLTAEAARAQQKNPFDGYDEGSIEFMKGMAKDVFKDNRPLEQIFKDNAFIRAVWYGDMNAVDKA